jgi:hypothetical protein
MNASDANVSTASTTARCGGLPATQRTCRRTRLCPRGAPRPRPCDRAASGHGGGCATAVRPGRARIAGSQDTIGERGQVAELVSERQRWTPARGEPDARPCRRSGRVLPLSLSPPARRASRSACRWPAAAFPDLVNAGLVSRAASLSPAIRRRWAASVRRAGNRATAPRSTSRWKHHAHPRVNRAWVLMTSRSTCRQELSNSSRRRGLSLSHVASIPPESCHGKSCGWRKSSGTSQDSSAAAASGSASGKLDVFANAGPAADDGIVFDPFPAPVRRPSRAGVGIEAKVFSRDHLQPQPSRGARQPAPLMKSVAARLPYRRGNKIMPSIDRLCRSALPIGTPFA